MADKFEFFTLDARLSTAQEIISQSILSSAPSQFSRSSDGKYFIQDSTNIDQPEHPPEDLGVIVIGRQRAWPTPENLNTLLFQKYPNNQMRLVRSGGRSFKLDLTP